MDLVDLIAEKRFLGQEFLTWLWYKSDERGGVIHLPEAGDDLVVVFEQHLLLTYGEGEASEQLICKGQQAELREARVGLLQGKKLEQARLRLARDEHEWRLTLRGSVFAFQSVRLPRTMAASEEGDDPDAVAGRLLDQIGLYETAVRTMDQLFRMFLAVRIGSDWPAELARLREWVHKAEAGQQ